MDLNYNMNMNSKIFSDRVEKLQGQFKSVGEFYLISKPSNIAYLTGAKTGDKADREMFVLVGQKTAIWLVSPLMLETYSKVDFLSVMPLGKNAITKSLTGLRKGSGSTLFVDEDDLRLVEFKQLKSQLDLKIEAGKGWLEKMRQVKDSYEIEAMEKSGSITSQVWEKIKKEIRAGWRERDIAKLIVRSLEDAGADGIPVGFEPIVASGVNSSIPHHQSGNKLIKENEVVLVDFGSSYSGYSSDMTRMVNLGNKSSEYEAIQTAVMEAYRVALSMVRVGVDVREVDKKAEEVIAGLGLSTYILHTTGHGLGLDIHEKPAISKRLDKEFKLLEGMVITIEPGLYIPGKFGFRYEDTVLVTADGYKKLTGVGIDN